jgi:hypothetical protein
MRAGVSYCADGLAGAERYCASRRLTVMPQTYQAEPQDHLTLPMCMRCRATAMSLTSAEEEYPGYQRRMFECLVCGEIMTQWAADPLASY